MRFTLHTSDGVGFLIKDGGKVFARGVLGHQITGVIERRIAGDGWRAAIKRMCSQWRGYERRHFHDADDEWDRWADIRRVSWNNRGRAMVNALNRGSWRPSGSIHIQSRVNKHEQLEWDKAINGLVRSWNARRRKSDEWTQWACNTASNQRKRMRSKKEATEGNGGSIKRID